MSKTLIISPNWIGDAVMTLPLIYTLSQNGHIVDILAPHIVAPIYEHSIDVAKVIQHNFPHKKILLKQRIKLSQQLQKNNYEYIYILPNSLKSMIIPILIKAKYKIGYQGEWPRKIFLTKSFINQGKKISMVEYYHNLVKQEKNILFQQKLQPKIDLDNEKSLECLIKFKLLNKKYIVVAIGAEYGPAKQWPLEYFKKLIEIIQYNYNNLYIILLGSYKDKEHGEFLVNNETTINLCGKTSLTQAMHIIKKADKVLTHDSGLMHIAAAIGTDLVAIYGSTSPLYTPPLSNNSNYIWLNLECSPCFQRTCPLKHYACLNNIKPQQVFEKLFQS
jgi:heptosyltransferase-2